MTDWRDRTFAALMQFGKWTHDAKLVRAFVEKYPEVVAWLQSKGMRFDGGGFDVAGRHDSILRMLERKPGYNITDPARGRASSAAVSGISCSRIVRSLECGSSRTTRATRILLDESGREVRGVLVSGPDGEQTIEARRVILAAGGFGANEEMMRRYFPEHFREEGPINTLCLGSQTGDGLAMAAGDRPDYGGGHGPRHHRAGPSPVAPQHP